MTSELQRIVLPTVYDYFNTPELKQKLRIVAEWGHSFETWLKFEIVFALKPQMLKMQGEPWDYEEWDMEKKIPGLGQVDLFFGGKHPLAIQLKVCHPCWYRGNRAKWRSGGKLTEGRNSLTRDVKRVSQFKRHAAACLLFTLEHKGAQMPFDELGIPSPEGFHRSKINLGNTWCEACLYQHKREEKQEMYCRFYYWTNGR